jgi:hypothetical protein
MGKMLPSNTDLPESTSSIFGLLGYCQQVLSFDVRYVPCKHSNQSSIEALFSYVCGANRDRATSYGAAVSINNLVNSKNALSKNNKYYSTDDMVDESTTVQVDQVFGR